MKQFRVKAPIEMVIEAPNAETAIQEAGVNLAVAVLEAAPRILATITDQAQFTAEQIPYELTEVTEMKRWLGVGQEER